MTTPANWRKWPIVCRSRYGSANSKAYRRVQIWNPPSLSYGGWLKQGAIAYKGPIRCLTLGPGDPIAWLGTHLVWAHMLGARL